MAIKITDDCINCGACEAECPNNAIYGPDELWKYSEGTSLSGNVNLHNGQSVDADASNQPVSEEFFFIVTNKCTEFVGFHEEPQCAAVCPVDCCVQDENHVEKEENLLGKQRFMHGEDKAL